MHPALRQAVEERGNECNGESFYRDFFAEAPIACFSVGVDGRVRAANRQALDLVGYRLPEVAGQSVLDLYADTSAGWVKAEEQFLRFRAGTEVHGAELEMRRADGTSVWITLSVRPIRERTGQVAASCSVVEEIQKKLRPAPRQLQQDHARVSFGSNGERFVQVNDFRPAQEHVKRLVIKARGNSYFVRVEDIDWVGAAGNYVELHIGPKSHLVRKTMNALEAKLDPHRFLRVHRTAIVNVERIKELRPWHYSDHRIVLFDGTQLTLKRCYSEKLEQLVGEPL